MIPGAVLARIKRWSDGNVLLITSAVFFIAVGSILATLVFSSVLWSGTAVQGVDRGGIVYYTYDGQTNSLDDTSRFYSHTVYLDPKGLTRLPFSATRLARSSMWRSWPSRS